MTAKLIYTAITSLDGFVADENDNFDWAAPDEEVHAFVNDLERDIGTYLLGRRLYEVMVVWETMDVAGEPDVMRDYAAIWRAADKIVYSATLQNITSARTHLEREFDAHRVREMKASATRDVSIGGANLASQAFAAGLVDEVCLFLNPVIIGAGTAALPSGVRHDLGLVDERRFTGGVVFLRYRVLI